MRIRQRLPLHFTNFWDEILSQCPYLLTLASVNFESGSAFSFRDDWQKDQGRDFCYLVRGVTRGSLMNNPSYNQNVQRSDIH